MATYDVTPAAIRSKIEQISRNFQYMLEHSAAEPENLRKETTRKLILQARAFVTQNPSLAGVCADLLKEAPQKFPNIFSPLPVYFEAAEFYAQAGNVHQIAEVYSNHIARIYLGSGLLLDAFEAFRRSVGIYYSLNMRSEISEADMNGFRQSFKAVLDAVLAPDEPKIDKSQLKFWLDYGMTRLIPELYKRERHEEALSFYNQTFAAMNKFGDTVSAARIRCRQGRILYKMGRLEESREKFVQAFNLFSTLVFKAHGAEINGILDGELYWGMNEFVKARQVDLALMLLAQYEGPAETMSEITHKLLRNVMIEKYAYEFPYEVARYVFFVANKMESEGRADLAYGILMAAVDAINKGELKHKIIMHSFLSRALNCAMSAAVPADSFTKAMERHSALALDLREVTGDEPFDVRLELRKHTDRLPPLKKYKFTIPEINFAFEQYNGKLDQLQKASPKVEVNPARSVLMFELNGASGGGRILERGL